MNEFELALAMPEDLEVWLFLTYALVVLIGAKLTEVLARVHFERARRYGEHGFQYDAEMDHYDCPQGERLTLHLVHPEQKVAVYRAPAARCVECPIKAACTPHDHGRHLYRPLAAWAETEVGRFHQRISLLMIGSASLITLVGLAWWSARPGSGLLLMVFLIVLLVAVREARRAYRASAGPDVDREAANYSNLHGPLS